MESNRKKRQIPLFRLIILSFLLCIFAACGGGGGGGGGDSDETDEPSTTVGISGGIVEDDKGAKISIPEGALSENYDISISSYTDNDDLPAGCAPMLEMRGAVSLEPEGLTFSKPVTLTVPVSEYMEPRTQFPLLYWNESEQVWEQTAFIATVADNGMSFSADVTHFSEYGGWAIEDLIYGGTVEQFQNDFTAWFQNNVIKENEKVTKNNECFQVCGMFFDLEYEINGEKGGKPWRSGDTETSDYSDAPLLMVDYTYDISKGHSLDGYVRITVTVHYDCAKPSLEVMADKTTLDEGESTTVNALLRCNGMPLMGKNITFSHTGPGEINPANITTNTSGSAASTFTAGNADAVIKAYYVGCEFGDSYTMEASVSVKVSGKTSLNIFIESDTESGGMVITTSGTVPLSLTTDGANETAVAGTGSLQVSGTASAGGDCSGIVSGETYVAVTGIRDAASTYDLTLILTQNAVLTVTCPKGGAVTPLIGSDAKEVTLSKSNGYLVTEQGADNGTTWVSEVSLDKP